MKLIKTLAITGTLAVAMASCGGNSTGDNASASLSGASQTDSLMYYFGQLRAYEYLREAANDSAMSLPESKKAFMQGVQAGFDAIRKNDENYNKGFYEGVQLAMNLIEFSEEFGVSIDKSRLISSMSQALRNDSVDHGEVQKEFYTIMNQLNLKKEEAEKAEAAKALAAEVARLKMTRVDDDLYTEVIKPGTGEKPADNSRVSLDIKFADMAGKVLNVPFPKEVVIGNNIMSKPVTAAIMSMKEGQTSRFASTSLALFGNRGSQFGLKPYDVVMFTITIDKAQPDSAAE